MAVRGDTVGRHSALQSDRSRVRLLIRSLGFFINLILLATVWPLCFGLLTERSTGDILWVAKSADLLG